MAKLILNEYSKNALLGKSRNADLYSPEYQYNGKNRFQRRLKSKIASSNKEYNQIDMNRLFKEDQLEINIRVNGETDIYLVTLSFGGFLAALRRILPKDKPEIEPNFGQFLRALIEAYNKNDIKVHCTCPDFCLERQSKLFMTSGNSYTIEELYYRFNRAEKFYVYAVDNNGNICPGRINDIWISGYTSELLKITFENNDFLITTPEHLYLTDLNHYEPAFKLEIGTAVKTIKHDNVIGAYLADLAIKDITTIRYDTPVPVYDLTIDKYNNLLTAAGPVIHNCYREAYWATRNGTNAGPSETRPADKTNPDDSKGFCKHINLVLANTSWTMKTASVIFNYTKYIKNHNKDLYKSIIYPAIFETEYQEVDTAENGTDEPSEETIDIINKWSRTKSELSSQETSEDSNKQDEKTFNIDSVV